MSSWNGESDEYNSTSGFYNITLPGPAETQTILLFASAKNGSNYYGSYKNISVDYGTSGNEYNFTMYGMLGNSSKNITMYQASNFSETKNIATKKQTFNLVNSSNSLIYLNSEAHVEVNLDYYGVKAFTFMVDTSSNSSSFSVPLLNVTGIEDINFFSTDYAPKRVSTKTASEILTNPNITLGAFNPGDIEGNDISSSVQVALYKSNSTCNLPNPSSSCIIADSASMNSSEQDSFNPLNAIVGGGKLNFRMGLLSSGITVEYINVDMLASGPPDALFDDNTTESTSGDFGSAMRFGGNGPTIYDYVLVSMPYTEGSSSQTGLNESADVNMTIPLLYDEDWNVIWNASANGTDGNSLAGNNSHYSAHPSEWETLMGNNTCVTSQSNFNSTNPCFIDSSNNRIWIRLPHFSGTKPDITGNLITADSTSDSSSGDSGSGSGTEGGTTLFWKNTFVASNNQLLDGFTREYSEKERAKVKVENEDHYVGIISLTNDSATINVSSDAQQAVFNIGDEKKFEVTGDDYYDLLVKLNSINGTKANVTIKSINEKIVNEIPNGQNPEGNESSSGIKNVLNNIKNSNSSVKIVISVIALVIIMGIIFLIVFRKKLSDWFLRLKNKNKV